MKSLHIASILALSAATVFACNDDEDRYGFGNSAGTTSGEAGGPGASGSAGQGPDVGVGGAGAGAAGADAGGGGATDSGAAGQAGMAGNAGESSEGGEGGGAAGLGGEAGSGGAPNVDPLELIGAYDDNYGGSFEITADLWGAAAIAAYDNAQNVVYTQHPANDQWNPNKFAKTVYTEPTASGSFYFCMVVYAAETLAAAQASTATADDSDPESGGCGGQFAWTKATPQ